MKSHQLLVYSIARQSRNFRVQGHIAKFVPNAHRQRSFATVVNEPLDNKSTNNSSHDVVIVGSGAAALTAALRLKSQGLRPLIVEKTGFVGGCSGYSGGGLWIPNSGVHRESKDSKANALEYMNHVIPKNAGRAASAERREAFLDKGPQMVQFLKSQGFEWMPSIGYPDYYPELPGGMPTGGRSIEGALFDLNELGKDKSMLIQAPLKMPMHTFEAKDAVRTGRTWKSVQALWKVVAIRGVGGKVMGKDYVGMGQALVARLFLLNLQAKNEIWVNTPMKQIVIDKNGKAVGIVVEKEGKQVQVIAPRGVLIAAGGFSQNAAMRGTHHGVAFGSDWTSTPRADTGDAVVAAARDAGVHLTNMHQAWWGPTLINPRTKERLWEMNSRCYPHSIIVDSEGQRFTNEAQGYVAFGEDQIARHKTTPAIPAVMVLDARHRKQYMLGGNMPGITSSQSIKDGLIYKADTIQELAQKMHVSPEGLQKQIDRFNTDASKGVDSQYKRGSSAYDQYFGDETYPNPCLGTIEKPPFYAAFVYPGDLGTSGGILTDEYARALREDGSVIEGLYATGNSTASVMGGSYPGSGSTLGPALTFGFIAANHMASRSVE